MFNPCPKPEKTPKKAKKPLKRTAIKKQKQSKAIRYTCSNGEKVTQAIIDRNLTQSYSDKHSGKSRFVCEGCGYQAMDNSHIISKARCKELGKTELIWDKNNYFNACRVCHQIWETYKSGEFRHLNVTQEAMAFIKLHDPDSYSKRINHM